VVLMGLARAFFAVLLLASASASAAPERPRKAGRLTADLQDLVFVAVRPITRDDRRWEQTVCLGVVLGSDSIDPPPALIRRLAVPSKVLVAMSACPKGKDAESVSVTLMTSAGSKTVDEIDVYTGSVDCELNCGKSDTYDVRKTKHGWVLRHTREFLE